MAADFQEYKGKRKPVNTNAHKFPLLRLLLIAVAAFFVYWSGLAVRFVDWVSFLGGDESNASQKSWQDLCLSYAGSPFELNGNLVQCSWVVNDSTDLMRLPGAFARYVAGLRRTPQAKLHWVSARDNFTDPSLVMVEDSAKVVYFHYMKPDSSYVWVSKSTGCFFPGACPRLPLKWSALPIADDFDFEGQDVLLATDVFRGIGEAPVHPVLGGRVIALGRDSLGYFVDLDHGYNVTSRTSGLGSLNETLALGHEVLPETNLGSLPPQDSATFFLTIRRNGQFVRWKDFYESTHPVSADDLENFEKSLGF